MSVIASQSPTGRRVVVALLAAAPGQELPVQADVWQSDADPEGHVDTAEPVP
jgi:hypothetical protein